MKTILLAIIAAGWIVLVSTAPVYGQVEEVRDSKAAGASNTPERMIGVTEDIWIQLADEPEHHMNDAFASFQRDESESAAVAVRKVTVFLRIAEINSSKSAKKALGKSASNLDDLADQFSEPEKKVTTEQLRWAFSSGHLAMARHHGQRSREAARDRDIGLAGRYLLSSTRHLERASFWAGRELQAETAKQVEDAQKLGRELSDEGGKAMDDLGDFLESIGKRIERFGQRVREDQKPKRSKDQ